jgi:hypothetical protein
MENIDDINAREKRGYRIYALVRNREIFDYSDNVEIRDSYEWVEKLESKYYDEIVLIVPESIYKQIIEYEKNDRNL